MYVSHKKNMNPFFLYSNLINAVFLLVPPAALVINLPIFLNLPSKPNILNLLHMTMLSKYLNLKKYIFQRYLNHKKIESNKLKKSKILTKILKILNFLHISKVFRKFTNLKQYFKGLKFFFNLYDFFQPIILVCFILLI